jgi:hypothetical protein
VRVKVEKAFGSNNKAYKATQDDLTRLMEWEYFLVAYLTSLHKAPKEELQKMRIKLVLTHMNLNPTYTYKFHTLHL